MLPYRGYANEERIYLKGRILEDENIYRGQSSSRFRNLINSFKRFETDEVPGAKVKISCHDQVFECVTDYEGYFVVDEDWEAPDLKGNNRWVKAEIKLVEPRPVTENTIKRHGEIYLPSRDAEYGVITDIDDTILQTHVSSRLRLKMLYATFFKNAQQRLPVEGMAKLFNSFVRGSDGRRVNPIFYISHSPWNIYDLLEEFLQIQDFPKGPIMLRDFGLKPSGEYEHHKIHRIGHILKTYQELPFVLLGDAAEEDADFYIDIANTFPNRIRTIYIRETKNRKNAERVKNLIEANSHVDAVLVKQAEHISMHALDRGLLYGMDEGDDLQ